MGESARRRSGRPSRGGGGCATASTGERRCSRGLFLYFGYRYFLRLGFLDGRAGLVFHFLQGCWYRFQVDALLYESRSKGRPRK